MSFEFDKNGNIRNTNELINMIDLNKKEVLFIEFVALVKTISGKNIEEDLSDFRVQLPLLDKVNLLLPNIRYFFIVGNKYGIIKPKEIGDFNTELFCVDVISQHHLADYPFRFVQTDCRVSIESKEDKKHMMPNTWTLKDLCDKWLMRSYGGQDGETVRKWCYEKKNMLMIGKTECSKECSNNFGIDYVCADDFLTNN